MFYNIEYKRVKHDSDCAKKLTDLKKINKD